MSTKKATKRALLTSVLAIVLCLVMLIGSTFAWFTDTASTGVNKIQSGTLDIDVSYTLDGEEWAPLNEASDLFGNGLFEPGYTRVVAFKIENKGTLALKYNMSMNIANEKKGVNMAGEEFALSDYLKVKTSPIQEVNQIGDIMVAIAFDRATSNAIGWNPEVNFNAASVMANDEVLLVGGAHYFIMQVYMPETVGNEANARSEAEQPSIDFGVAFTATQATVESDSFNNQYDKDATYPTLPTVVTGQDDLNDVITNTNEPISVKLAEGTYTLPNLENKDITISGTKDTVIDMKGAINKASSASFDGVTVEFANEGYKGFQHTGKLTYKDCTIKGLQFLYADEVEFINCEFVQENDDSYHIWTYGAKNVTFTNCTFNSTNNSKAVLCYIEGTGNTFTRTFNNCKFVATGTAEKSAIMINPSANEGTNTYTININNCTATGYAENGITGQTIVGVKETVKDNITVNIDGTAVYTH